MKPFVSHFCKFLSKLDFDLSCIIDVGVLTSTVDLLENFPKTKHILIEPQAKYFSMIKYNYKNIDYELYNIGLDKNKGVLYLHSHSIDDNDFPTHNKLSETESNIKVNVDTLDNISEKLEKWILLKIDVDGKEKDILNGGYECLKKCAFVIIEAQQDMFIDICKILQEQNFSIFNICDICYVKNSFWQCDLIFINNNVKSLYEEFDPYNSWKSDESIFKNNYFRFVDS